MRGSALQDALEYVDLEENFAIQQSKKRESNAFSSGMACKTMVASCCVPLLTALGLHDNRAFLIVSNCVVAIATRQGSKKPAVLDQKKAYNICEWLNVQIVLLSVLILDPILHTTTVAQL